MATRNSKKKKPAKSSSLPVNKKGQLKKDMSASYKQFKEFEGEAIYRDEGRAQS